MFREVQDVESCTSCTKSCMKSWAHSSHWLSWHSWILVCSVSAASSVSLDISQQSSLLQCGYVSQDFPRLNLWSLLLHTDLQLKFSSAPISVRSETGILMSPWLGGEKQGGLLESGTEQERLRAPLTLFSLCCALLLTGELLWERQSISSVKIKLSLSLPSMSSAQRVESQPPHSCRLRTLSLVSAVLKAKNKLNYLDGKTETIV